MFKTEAPSKEGKGRRKKREEGRKESLEDLENRLCDNVIRMKEGRRGRGNRRAIRVAAL